MADFSNFELMGMRNSPGVYDLADGLIPEMAQVFSVELGDKPNVESLGNLVGQIGTNKVLQENIAHVQEVLGTDSEALTIAADWLDRSGVQEPLDRSLWTPRIETPTWLDSIVITGGVANWMDRTTALLERRDDLSGSAKVYIPVGNRVMSTPTETPNLNVMQFQNDHENEFPTEAQFAETFVLPRLSAKSYDVEIVPVESKDGAEIAEAFVTSHPEVFFTGKTTAFARVANAGVQLAVQFRSEAKKYNPVYDADTNKPQVFVLTDHFPVAGDADQAKDPKSFQNPMTGIRQIAVTAKFIQEAIS